MLLTAAMAANVTGAVIGSMRPHNESYEFEFIYDNERRIEGVLSGESPEYCLRDPAGSTILSAFLERS